MKDFCIICDSACDLSRQMLKDRDVDMVSLHLHFDGDPKQYSCYDIESDEFYNKMRSGCVAKTSGVNVEEFTATFEPILRRGNNIIYIGFSSALSMTYSAAHLAASSLSRKYPKRKIAIIDSLCASAGIALLIDLALQKKSSDASFDEVVKYIETMKHKINHWFTVDDLEYLKRGGRISKGSAFFGNALGIKPLLHVDNSGCLVNKAKIRGRHATLLAMCEKYMELKDGDHDIYISHADCIDDAKRLSILIKENFNTNTGIITNVGPVIGSHAGPGTLALFFVGKRR